MSGTVVPSLSNEELVLQHVEYQAFLKKHHFDKNIATFKHPTDEAENGSPAILFKGKLTPWAEVKKQIKYQADEKPLTDWFYLEQGLVPWNTTKWEKLKPFRTLPEGQRPSQPILEVRNACKGDMPSCFSNYGHSWINITLPNGEVYSFGFYAPEEFIRNPGKPIKTLNAVIQCPDPYEFLPGRTREKVSYKITPDKAKDTLRLVEAYQNVGLLYNGLEQNCSDFVKAILEFAIFDTEEKRAKEPLDMSVGWYSSLPISLQKMGNWIWVHTPSLIQSAVTAVWKRVIALSLAPLMLYLGGRHGYHLEEGTDDEVEVEAVLPSVFRLLNYKVLLNHNMGVRRWMRLQPTWERV